MGPAIAFTAPAADVAVPVGAPVTLAWTDADPDDDATIDLYADTDPGAAPWSGSTGVLLATRSEDADGAADTFAWDTAGTAPGTYAIWARISDGTQTTFARADGAVMLEAAPAGVVSSLDVDGDGSARALTDGALIVRYLFGLRGADLTADMAPSPTATRVEADAIAAFLDAAVATMLDADGSGAARPFTDGTLIVRYLFGLRGNALVTSEVLEPAATRTDAAAIAAFMDDFHPAATVATRSTGAAYSPLAGDSDDDDPLSRWLAAAR